MEAATFKASPLPPSLSSPSPPPFQTPLASLSPLLLLISSPPYLSPRTLPIFLEPPLASLPPSPALSDLVPTLPIFLLLPSYLSSRLSHPPLPLATLPLLRILNLQGGNNNNNNNNNAIAIALQSLVQPGTWA